MAPATSPSTRSCGFMPPPPAPCAGAPPRKSAAKSAAFLTRAAAGPSWRTSPSTSTMAREATRRAARTFCSTRRIVVPPALIRAKRVEDLRDEARREAGRRLVEHEHRRLGDQRPRDGQHLPLPAREPSGQLARPRAEVRKARIGVGDGRLALASRPDGGGQRQVLGDREGREDVLGLRHEGQAARDPGVRRHRREVPGPQATRARHGAAPGRRSP